MLAFALVWCTPYYMIAQGDALGYMLMGFQPDLVCIIPFDFYS
ncbi:hypothetical protein HMPREF0650_0206 [Hoylesella buccalis ATCC 35310]|uniref:Uncharacterized protein n=1 Tax=Hoylesella buccalis ATCC 35310 TaxID=679190 RepID=D1W927_9BACT|nr:hypothetical protein HMPREF0650_0206 [Hoylesella buccalis ATCC 35310]